jgi:hypothetical protein
MRLSLSIASLVFVILPLIANADDHDFIRDLSTISTITSTVPANGDVNPYGVATVPISTGALVKGDILISNFNNSSNLQGTGTTIVEISPSGNLKVFATIDAGNLPGSCPGGVGLTTALAVLRSGFVIVGSLPTSDGTSATAQAGCLIVLNSSGHPILTLAGNGINGPWDMAAVDFDYAAVLFVTNVLNGTVAANGSVVSEGSVLRILLLTPPGGTPRELGRKIIASGFEERTDPAALVLGPTGLGFAPDGRLFVADTLQNRIAVIPDALFRIGDAGAGTTVSQGGALNQPLGLAIAPDGDILTVNGGDGNIVETRASGKQVAVKGIDVSQLGAGTLFGLAITPNGKGVYFVDDGNNTLNLLH